MTARAAGRQARDDLEAAVVVPREVRRIVSLVPSLSETVVVSGGALVGCTDWCTHPAAALAGVTRIGGTKNPNVAAVIALEPDLVLANEEENRREDVEALRAAGLAVWVTAPRTVSEALTSLGRVLAVCDLPERGWWRDAITTWTELAPPVARRRAFVPIWRKPWMSLGRDTFAGDVLSRLGIDHVFANSDERYPRVTLDDVRARGVDLVVLPDEPYAFGPADLDAFADWQVEVAFVTGRYLTWYGPSLVEAPDVLRRQLYECSPPG